MSPQIYYRDERLEREVSSNYKATWWKDRAAHSPASKLASCIRSLSSPYLDILVCRPIDERKKTTGVFLGVRQELCGGWGLWGKHCCCCWLGGGLEIGTSPTHAVHHTFLKVILDSAMSTTVEQGAPYFEEGVYLGLSKLWWQGKVYFNTLASASQPISGF